MKKILSGILLVVCNVIVVAANGASTSDGAAVYQNNCVACHGPQAIAVYAGKVPALAGRPAAETIDDLKAYRADSRNEYGMGAVMSAQAQLHLKSDDDIDAVANYIESQR